MLRIKQEVDLKELEKFGFKPKYDCDTGNILYYYRDYFTDKFYTASGWDYRHYQIRVNKREIKIEKGTRLKKKGIKTNFFYDMPPIYSDGFGMFVDLLFDVIQAGLVEKVD